MVHIPATVIPQGNGTILVIPGRPKIVEEMTTSEFAKMVGISRSYALFLCNQGAVSARKLSPSARSRFMIPSSEVERFRNLQ